MRHFAQGVFRYSASALPVTLETNGQRNVEEDRVGLTAVSVGDGDVRMALFGREVRSIYVRYWPPQRQALPQQVTQGLKDLGMNALIGFVVREQISQRIGRQSGYAEALEISGLPRPGQPD